MRANIGPVRTRVRARDPTSVGALQRVRARRARSRARAARAISWRAARAAAARAARTPPAAR